MLIGKPFWYSITMTPEQYKAEFENSDVWNEGGKRRYDYMIEERNALKQGVKQLTEAEKRKAKFDKRL